MRAVLVVSALAVLLLVPLAGAHPPALVGKTGKTIYGKRHFWLHQAKAPLVGGRVRLISSGCPGQPRYAGCVLTGRPRTLYVRPGATRRRSVIYHELGHTFDLTLL